MLGQELESTQNIRRLQPLHVVMEVLNVGSCQGGHHRTGCCQFDCKLQLSKTRVYVLCDSDTCNVGVVAIRMAEWRTQVHNTYQVWYSRLSCRRPGLCLRDVSSWKYVFGFVVIYSCSRMLCSAFGLALPANAAMVSGVVGGGWGTL